MTFLLGLMPWWGWILVVLAGIGLAMFPVQVLAIAKRVPLKAWLALAAILIVFGAYRIGYQVRGTECEEANKAAQDAADKQSTAQEQAAPVIAQEAQEAVQPQVIERVRIIREQIPSTVSCPDYDAIVQSEIRKAKAAADRVR